MRVTLNCLNLWLYTNFEFLVGKLAWPPSWRQKIWGLNTEKLIHRTDFLVQHFSQKLFSWHNGNVLLTILHIPWEFDQKYQSQPELSTLKVIKCKRWRLLTIWVGRVFLDTLYMTNKSVTARYQRTEAGTTNENTSSVYIC